MDVRKIIKTTAFVAFLAGAAINHQFYHIRWLETVTGLGILAYTIFVVVACGMFALVMTGAVKNPTKLRQTQNLDKVRAAFRKLDRNWFKFAIGMYPAVLIVLAGYPVQAVLIVLAAFGSRYSLHRMRTVMDRLPV